jgi:hypothetical protein
MEERGFSEVELRAMLEDAISIERGSRPGRWVVRTRHANRSRTVILETEPDSRTVAVVTAWPG